MSERAPAKDSAQLTTTHEDDSYLDASAMSIWDHIEELRTRLLRSIIVLIITAAVIALFFADDILDYLASPYIELTNGEPLEQLEPTGSITLYVRIVLMSAAIVSIPYLTYEMLMFVLPGLTKKERRAVLTAIPFATGFFLSGVAFTWFIMIPAAFEFLINFQSDVFNNQWQAQRYFAFLTSLLFWMGVAFEMPIVMYVFGRLGLIGPGTLIRSWRFAIVAIAIAAATITPTVDPFNMVLVMAPMLALYIVSIIFVAIAQRTFRRNIGEL
ncbi:MAG: twin-arginine translocase subunit TatC [Phototrophicales bacterium]|nr:MAG: twin-arginine translocase subunit TatC [Phototrophicales bacterium]